MALGLGVTERWVWVWVLWVARAGGTPERVSIGCWVLGCLGEGTTEMLPSSILSHGSFTQVRVGHMPGEDASVCLGDVG